MNRWDDDSDLKALFQEIHETGNEPIPPFRRVWSSARSVQRPVYAVLRFSRFAAAAALFVFLGIYVANRQGIRPDVGRSAAVSLSEWKAPTDFLLETPGIEVLQSVPAFGSTGIAYAVQNQTQE